MKIPEAIRSKVCEHFRLFISDPTNQLNNVAKEIGQLIGIPISKIVVEVLNELFNTSSDSQCIHYFRLFNQLIMEAESLSLSHFTNEVSNSFLTKLDLDKKSSEFRTWLSWHLKSWKSTQYFNTFKLENVLESKLSPEERLKVQEMPGVQNQIARFRYDLVIECDSLLKLSKKGWEVVGKRTNDFASLQVSILGNPNVGKSFILAALSGQKLPSGFNVATKGISVFYSNNKNVPITYIDTQGQDSAIHLFEKEEESKANIPDEQRIQQEGTPGNQVQSRIEQKVTDRRVSETLVQQFIMSVADVILIVVETLKFSDQKLIEKILKANKKGDGKKIENKKIFVIHNYSQLTRIEDVQAYISADVIKSFDVVETIIPEIEQGKLEGCNIRYWAETKDDATTILHFVLAREGTEAGDFYNKATYNFLLMLMKTMPNRSQFSPVEEFKKFMKDNVTKFIDISPEKATLFEHNLQQEPSVSKNQTILLKGFGDGFKFRDLSVDIFDTVIASMMNKESSITPKYCLTEDDHHVICMVEAPGIPNEILKEKVKGRIGIQGDGYVVHLKGCKDPPCPREYINKSFQNSIEYGDFDIQTISIPTNRLEVEKSKLQKTVEHGIVTFKWPKVVKQEDDFQ